MSKIVVHTTPKNRIQLTTGGSSGGVIPSDLIPIYGHANLAYHTANLAYGSVNSNWTVMNVVYATTNANYTMANAGYVTLNAAYDTINANYASSNSNWTVQNLVYSTVNAVYDMANADYAFSNAAYASINSNWTVQNLVYATVNANYVMSNASYNTLNTAFIMANAGYVTLNAAYDTINANYASSNSNWTVQNALYTTTNSAYGTINAAYASANSNWAVQNALYTTTNSAYATINAAYASSNSNWQVQNALYTVANTNYIMGNAAYNTLNAAYATINANYASANSNWTVQNTLYATTNAAYTLANAAYANANSLAIGANAWSNHVGLSANSYAGFMANSSNIYTEATYVKLSSPTSQLITSDIGISGNLTIAGETIYANVTQLQVGDSIVTLNADLPPTVAPLENAGIEVNRGNKSSNAALLWIESSEKWSITGNIDQEISTFIASNTDLGKVSDTVNANYASANSNWVVQNLIYATVNAAYVMGNANYVVSNTAYNTTNSVYLYANAIHAQVNYGWGVQNLVYATVNANYVMANANYVVSNSAYATINAVYASSNSNWQVQNALYDLTNTSYIMGNAAYNTLNAAYDTVNTAYASANSNWTVQNLVYATVNANYVMANAGYDTLNAAYTTLNAAYATVNADYAFTNSAYASINSNWEVQNAAYLTTNAAYTMGNANYVVTNSAFDTVNAVYASANSNWTVQNLVYATVNSAYDSGNSNWAVQNALYDLTNTVYASANSNWVVQNLVYATTNSAYMVANAAYANANAVAIGANTWANTKLANTNNVWTAGSLNIAQDLFVNRNITNVTQLIFNTGTNITPTTPGALTWSQDDNTLHFDMDTPTNVIQHIGQDMYYFVKNQTGETIPKGSVVRFAGTVGASGRLLISKATANNSIPSKYVMGVTASDIAQGTDGFVYQFGKMRGLDTSMYNEGDILYLSSSTPGALQNTQPQAPNNCVTVAAVIYKDSNIGSMQVRLTLGSNLGDDELVTLNGLANGDLVRYNTANLRFENFNENSTGPAINAEAAFASTNSNWEVQNLVYATVNASYGMANAGYVTLNSAYDMANAGYVVSNSAFAMANAALPNTSGVTFNGNLVISGNANVKSLLTNTYIDFTTLPYNSPLVPYRRGRLWYDSDAAGLQLESDNADFPLSMGEREWVRCHNNSGAPILKGQPVYITGVHVAGHPIHGHHPTIALADASDPVKKEVIGLAGHDISDGTHGYVVVRGWLANVNTSMLTTGDRVHLGFSAPGTLTDSVPEYPNWPMDIGTCLTQDANNGTLYVQIFDHSFESIRVAGPARVGGDMTVEGDFTVLGTQTITNMTSASLGTQYIYLSVGDSIGNANVTFTGTGLNDIDFQGHYEGIGTTPFYVKITEANATGDYFSWSYDNFATTEASNTIILYETPELLSNGISVYFFANTGHTIGNMWNAAATAISSDAGFVTNHTNPGRYTHAGLFRDATDGTFRFFNTYDPEPVGNITITNNTFTLANVEVLKIDAQQIFADGVEIGGLIKATSVEANLTYMQANTAYDKANAANVLAYDTGIAANSYSGYMANSVNSYADYVGLSVNTYASILSSNNAVGANNWANTVGIAGNNYTNYVGASANAYATATYYTRVEGTSSYTTTNAAFDKANAAYNTANTGYGSTNSNWTVTNTVYSVANASFAKVNTALQNTNVTLAGNLATQGNTTVNYGFAFNFAANAYMYYNSACNSIDFVIN